MKLIPFFIISILICSSSGFLSYNLYEDDSKYILAEIEVSNRLTEADELKMIIHNLSDFQFAEEQAKKVGEKCTLFLQPEWSKREKMIPLIVDYVMQHPKWKISLQTHKYLNIP